MAFSVTGSPVYGGGTILIDLSGHEKVSSEDVKLHLVFEGEFQRHITKLRHHTNDTYISVIPAHHKGEIVQLSVLYFHGNERGILAATQFKYDYDSAFYMAQFLVESVYNVTALDDLELIRSGYFDLSNEILDTLDDRLYKAFTYLDIPEWWHLLGSTSPIEGPDQQARETLVHFAARLGLYKVASFLLDKPGSEQALLLPNRHGNLPRQIAEEQGYTGLAEVLTEYNPNFVKLDTAPIQTDYGVITYYENRDVSLSTYLQRPVEEEVHILQHILRDLEKAGSPLYHRQSQTDWPDQQNMDQENINMYEETTDSKLKAIILKSKDLQVVMEALGNHDYTSDHTFDTSPARSVDDDLSDNPSEKDFAFEKGELEERGTDSLQGDGYEGSLADLHGFNQELLRQRDYHRNLLIVQDVRKENLSRFSSSCPSLDSPECRDTLQLSFDDGHHKSMLNLAKDEEQSEQLAGESTSDFEELQNDYTGHRETHDVQICINGITVDGTEEFCLDASLNKFLRQYYGGNTPGVRRRSFGNHFFQGQNLQLQNGNSQGSLDGKSMSLNSLECDEDTDDDDLYHDAKEMQTPNSQGNQNPRGVDMALSLSPIESPCSSPMSKDMPDASMYESPEGGESTLVRTLFNLKQELITPRDRKMEQLQQQEILSGQSGESADEDTGVLTVPHSSMTKSLSTPSIPHAVSPGDRKGQKDPKQHDGTPTYLLIQKLIEDHDAQFRRQDEIEEDDDENTNRLLGQSDHNRRRSELSLIDFLNDPSNLEDQSKSSKKEDKKRKTSVFSRFQNSYRTKKHKEKENKGKNTHQFVSVSFSNSTMCHVCRKSMANKAALRCENCLVNVHESSCKDQITPCDRYRSTKVPQLTREAPIQMTNVLLRDKQSSLPTSVVGLRQTQSFKEKRSSSAPTGRSQVTSAPVNLPEGSQQAPLLSSIPDTEPDSVSQNTPQYQQHRRSLPTNSKAINEETEGDAYGSGPEIGHSNITDTISESLESLDETDSTSIVSDRLDDELLMLRNDEAETWSGSIDKKALKKMSHKDIKRQDTIWELIQTERHHCRNLKILQRIYSRSILEDVGLSQELVDRLFPELDDLIDIHMTFLHNLQDLQNRRPDHSVEHIGETLVAQFNGETALSMKKAYGAFCCGQKDSGQLYKELLVKDRKFLNYMKKCNNHSLCQKREIPDFLLLVTQRPAKYLTLIEAILKGTKDKKDREHLITALSLSKELLQSIDEQVSEQERRQRLIEIYHKMDQRTTAIYKGKKFKKSDLLSGRQLVREGVVGLKNARGKSSDVIAVLLTDLVFFMQETNGKYTFFSQDNKSSVIPLFQLLVREKGDTRTDSRGIYLISQNKQNPEMYEIVCNTTSDRRNWVTSLRATSEKCPEDAEDAPPDESEEDKKISEAKSAKMNKIIEQLHMKDQEIKQCCDEKKRLMVELLDIYSARPDNLSKRPSSMVEEEGTEHIDALQAAIQEVTVTASRLTTMLQGSGSHLSRHVSSVGEHVSQGFSLPPLPKRAETFSGFDSSFDIPKGPLPKKKLMPDLQQHLSLRSASPTVDKTDSDSEMSQMDTSNYEKPVEHDDSLEGSRTYSDAESLGDISGSSTQSSMLITGDHMTSISQLGRTLHSIVHLTAQQETAVESLRAQLAEANERINKLSNEVHERKGGYRHNQLEELRNLQEMVRKEKQDFQRKKDSEKMAIEHELSKLEENRQSLQQKEDDLEEKRKELYAEIQAQKDDLKLKNERLQAQIELWESQRGKQEPGHLTKHASAPGMSHLDKGDKVDPRQDGVTYRDHSPDPSGQANVHRRSASADFCQMIENDLDQMRQGKLKTSRRDLPSRTDSTRSGYSSFSTSHSSANKMNLPEHLLSAKNEHKVAGTQKIKQQIPSRGVLSPNAPPSVSAGATGKSAVQQMLPSKLLSGSSTSSLSGVAGSNSASQQPKHFLSNRANYGSNKPASTSSLSLVMKLAEPSLGNKGRSSSLTTVPSLMLGDKAQAMKSASVDISSSSQGQSDKKESDSAADSEIYC